jgi:hypothetical protein
MDGQARSVYDVLQDPEMARALSDEGPMPNLRGFMARTANDQPCGLP